MATATTKSKRKSKSASGKKGRRREPTLAELADKFDCYQKSVQEPEHEVEFFEQAFRDAYGRRPFTLREDFSGTSAVCCEWVKSRKKRTAVGVDLCGETLQWARDNNVALLSKHEQGRVRLVEEDVRSKADGAADGAADGQVDVLAAQNFSFWFFKERSEVVDYFKIARENLNAEGVMVMDMMGGGDCYTEGHTDRRVIGKGKKAFGYEWEQERFDPITRDATMHIHFSFSDGSRMDRAFSYHWRFWTIPEVREMLAEAGFAENHVYWEQEDEDGEDTGEFARQDAAENCDAWVCYIVAVK
ncbi:MAG: class I SAM-dependent methyltransferase [Planctomycetota bacterium]